MSRLRIVVVHLIAFVLLSVGFVFGLSSYLIEWLLPGYHQVEHWLLLVLVGVVLIFIGCIISMVWRLSRSKRGS